MTVATDNTTAEAPAAAKNAGKVRFVGIVSLVAGLIMAVAGVFTWVTVADQLADQNITVAEDAASFAGAPVDGPFTAYAQAQIIDQHTMESTGGLTYAELDREDPLRAMAMNSSFLQASLFTAVVSFGVAAFATGMGALLVLMGLGFIWTIPSKRD